jgi:SAM-dependent methyltransferase
MDDIARHNQARWDELARSGVEYARPYLDLTRETARAVVDARRMLDRLGALEGREVLCLASGGGQQSVAFALLGARTTVLDLSSAQLERDREAAAHYGLSITAVQGDMRDLSMFGDAHFDVVWHAYSINFVPDVRPVLAEVVRVLRPGGLYRLDWANPFTANLDESDWCGHGYPLRSPYRDGEELAFDHPGWTFRDGEGNEREVPGPREFRHGLGTVINGLLAHGLQLLGIWEHGLGDPEAAPGTWEHLKAVAPRWLECWAIRAPARP